MTTHLSLFWDDWIERFKENSDKYIKPNDKGVESIVDELDLSETGMPVENAEKTWRWIYKNIRYKLSKKWKTPSETLESGIGDCEDVTFLFASVMANLEMEDNYIKVGELIRKNDGVELHTWNELDGKLVDATGSPDGMEGFKYKEIESFRIEVL